MDVVPLLAHKDEVVFKTIFMEQAEVVREDRGQSNRTYQELELSKMGQSAVKHNQIEHSVENEWSLPNSTIKLNVQEILQIKEVFKMLARLTPEDQCISKQTFLHYFPLDGMLGQRLFGIFDKNGDEKINAGEFLSGVSLCLRGTMTDKCNLLFHMFDIDEDQGVSEDELYNMLKPTLKAADSLSKKSSLNESNKEGEDFSETARLLVHEAFEECDLEQTGKLSVQNFQTWLSGHKELVKAVFNYPFLSLLSKNSRYEGLQEREKRNRRLHPQTWMDECSDISSSREFEKPFNLENAKFLWSPLFPESSSMFPPCRSKHAAVLYHGSIYIFGGRGKASTLKDIWRYSLADNKWDQVKLQSGSPIPALEEHTAVIYKNHAYIFGGLFSTDRKTPFWSYEFESSKWKDLSHSKFQKEPLNRRGHSAVIYRDSMFLFGGILDTGHASNELWRYSFTTFRWHLMAPKEGTEVVTPRHSHSAVVHNSLIWIFGGIDTKGRKNDLWTWDFELFTWTRIKQKGGPSSIAKHTASKMGSSMIIFGGEGSSEPKNETWTFNFDSLEWNNITPLSSITPTHRSSHTTITLSPYSAHSGPVSFSRPSTTKSAPDTRRTGLSNNNPGFQHFHRAASAESILEYHENRLVKGKSLDLTFELDNHAFDKSLSDVTADPTFDVSSAALAPDNTQIIEVQPCSETNLEGFEEVPQFVQKNWAILVIAGKGKKCTDLYKTSVDLWRCDVGPDVGMQYQREPSTNQKTRSTDKARNRYDTSRLKGQKLFDRSTYIEGQSKDPRTDQGQTNWKRSGDYDRLIITDLTGDDADLDTAELDSGSLLR